jgi:hypothetical protein
MFFLYVAVFLVGSYILYSVLYPNPYSIMEGMSLDDISSTSTTTSTVPTTTTSNGIAGNAAAFGANLKAQSIKAQDAFLISKYRTDYENVIINMDDLVNSVMLQTTLTIDPARPQEALGKLVMLNNAKAALNNVMKFIDKT